MMRVTTVLASAALAGSLAACAAPPAPSTAAPSTAAPPPALASTVPTPGSRTEGGGIDGTYRSPTGGVTGNSACGTTRFGYPIRVVNGNASMQTVSAGRLEGPVAPDGSLLIQSGQATLRGQFSGNQFNGSYTNGRCSFTLTYMK